MRIIPLPFGLVATCDDEDYPLLSSFKWYAAKGSNGRFYIVTNIYDPDGKQTKVRMHHMVMGTPLRGLMIDHQDGCSANNCRSNLRVCTNSQNQWNTKGRRGASSRFKGVSWSGKYSKWKVAASANRKHFFGGYFDDELKAAAAANELSLRIHGPFAYQNNLDESSKAA